MVDALSDSRGRLLRTALDFAALPAAEPELRCLHRWLDSWPGIGHVVAGMAREGYDVELRRYDGHGWRAMFFPSGFEHSLTSHVGSAWAPSPWAAIQWAARDALHRIDGGDMRGRDWTTVDDAPR